MALSNKKEKWNLVGNFLSYKVVMMTFYATQSTFNLVKMAFGVLFSIWYRTDVVWMVHVLYSIWENKSKLDWIRLDLIMVMIIISDLIQESMLAFLSRSLSIREFKCAYHRLLCCTLAVQLLHLMWFTKLQTKSWGLRYPREYLSRI